MKIILHSSDYEGFGEPRVALCVSFILAFFAQANLQLYPAVFGDRGHLLMLEHDAKVTNHILFPISLADVWSSCLTT